MEQSAMVLSQVVKIGEIFEIKVNDVVTKTKLIDIIDDQHFVVIRPTIKGVPLIADRDEEIQFSFYRTNGVFTFHAVMEKYDAIDPMRCHFIIVSEVKKMQRRSSYRLPIVLDAVVSHLEPEVDIVGQTDSFRVKTVDLSEAGLMFNSYEFFPAGTLLSAYIILEKYNSITVNARVIRCVAPSNDTKKYNTSIMFVNISNRDQAKIGRFVLKKQIIDRKKLRELNR
jgi:c-di-GMP-binding flagellar brake protein YcgR